MPSDGYYRVRHGLSLQCPGGLGLHSWFSIFIPGPGVGLVASLTRKEFGIWLSVRLSVSRPAVGWHHSALAFPTLFSTCPLPLTFYLS